MTDRFLARSAVFVALRDKQGRVLLLQRANSGYMDGRYDIPAGHVERGETILATAMRELAEETSVIVNQKDLRLWHINQFCANDDDYYNFFFVVDAWHGEPKIMEPSKHSDMQFFAVDDLPKLTPGSHVALRHLGDKPVSFGYIDQAVYDSIAAD